METAVAFNSEFIIKLLIIAGSLFLAQSNITAAVSHSSMPTAFWVKITCGKMRFLFYQGCHIHP